MAADGVNDAAIEASDLTLVRGDLLAVPDAILLSRRTLATIKGNLFWAFGYDTAVIPLTALKFLNPLIAGPRWRSAPSSWSPTACDCAGSGPPGTTRSCLPEVSDERWSACGLAHEADGERAEVSRNGTPSRRGPAGCRCRPTGTLPSQRFQGSSHPGGGRQIVCSVRQASPCPPASDAPYRQGARSFGPCLSLSVTLAIGITSRPTFDPSRSDMLEVARDMRHERAFPRMAVVHKYSGQAAACADIAKVPLITAHRPADRRG